VLLVYPPGLDFITALLGCLYARVIAVPAYPPDPTRLDRTLPRLQAIATDSGASVLFTTAEFAAMREPICAMVPAFAALEWIATDVVATQRTDRWTDPGVTPDTLAIFQYTSGSTASPKGVMLTHRNVVANEQMILNLLNTGADDTVVGWVPQYHDFGLIAGILHPLYAGIHSVLMSPIHFIQSPVRWLRAISRYRGTMSGAPCFGFALCLKRIQPQDCLTLDLGSLRYAVCAGEPIRPGTLARFSETFAPCGLRADAVRSGYGLAEATLGVTTTPNGAVPRS